jgi:hypothetical protein
MWRVVLVLAVGWVCFGQSPPMPKFPSDGEDPKKAKGAQLLEAVCPGRVIDSERITCRGACPEFTSFGGDSFDWSLARVTFGHFLTPSSEDAVLWMSECEPHSENWGGTILLTRRAGRWTMVWYKPGVQTEHCHKVAMQDGREILVCVGQFGGQGNVWTALYVEDLLHPVTPLMGGRGHFFEVLDNVLACGGFDHESKIRRGFIESVTFGQNSTGQPAVSVVQQTGIGPKPESGNCALIKDLSAVTPATSPSRANFLFDGTTYRRLQ